MWYITNITINNPKNKSQKAEEIEQTEVERTREERKIEGRKERKERKVFLHNQMLRFRTPTKKTRNHEGIEAFSFSSAP